MPILGSNGARIMFKIATITGSVSLPSARESFFRAHIMTSIRLYLAAECQKSRSSLVSVPSSSKNCRAHEMDDVTTSILVIFLLSLTARLPFCNILQAIATYL